MHDVRETLILVTAGGPVLDLATVRPHLRIDSTDDDRYLNSLILIAQSLVDGRDGRLGRALLTQRWVLQRDRFLRYYPGGYPYGYNGAYGHDDGWTPWSFRRWQQVRIPLPPLQTINSVKYIDTSGNQQTLDPSQYRVVNGGNAYSSIIPVTGAAWPATAIEPDAVQIDFTCGYEDLAALKAERPGILHAMLLLIGLWYDNREAALVAARAAAVELPYAVEALLAPHRVGWF